MYQLFHDGQTPRPFGSSSFTARIINDNTLTYGFLTLIKFGVCAGGGFPRNCSGLNGHHNRLKRFNVAKKHVKLVDIHIHQNSVKLR